VNNHRLKAVASGYGSKPDRSALRRTGSSHTRAQQSTAPHRDPATAKFIAVRRHQY